MADKTATPTAEAPHASEADSRPSLLSRLSLFDYKPSPALTEEELRTESASGDPGDMSKFEQPKFGR